MNDEQLSSEHERDIVRRRCRGRRCTRRRLGSALYLGIGPSFALGFPSDVNARAGGRGRFRRGLLFDGF